MLSPAINTKSNLNCWRNATICAATSSCGCQPRPLSPMTANLIERSSLGSVSVEGATVETSRTSMRGCSRAADAFSIQLVPHPATARADQSNTTRRATRFFLHDVHQRRWVTRGPNLATLTTPAAYADPTAQRERIWLSHMAVIRGAATSALGF